LEVQNLSTKERVEDYYCRKLRRVKGFKYLDVFEECRKECMQKSHRIFSCKRKLRRVCAFKVLKRKGGVVIIVQRPSQR
jgi:hypothetical protein